MQCPIPLNRITLRINTNGEYEYQFESLMLDYYVKCTVRKNLVSVCCIQFWERYRLVLCSAVLIFFLMLKCALKCELRWIVKIAGKECFLFLRNERVHLVVNVYYVAKCTLFSLRL